MDGLEVTVLKLSEVLKDNTDLRLDCDFFGKETIVADALISNKSWTYLSDEIAYFGSGNNIPQVDESEFTFVRTQNVRQILLADDGLSHCIRDETLEFLKDGDLLFTRVGANVGDCIVCYKLHKAFYSDNTLKIRLKSLNPFYVSTFFNSKFGRILIKRVTKGSAQPLISRENFSFLKIPSFPAIQTQIERLVKLAHTKLEESKEFYREAENRLIEQLDLRDWRRLNENIAVKSFRASFLETGRLDAEYYHPEKTRMQELLDKFPGKTVGSYVSEIDEVINPLNDLESEPVMNFDLNDALPIYLDARETELADELGSSKKTFKRGDVVVSRLRSYLKEIAIVDTPEDAKTVGSSEFIVLRPSSGQVSAEALVVYLRSLPVQLILKWCQSGSNHPRFAEKDLLTIKVPDIVLDIQDTLQSNVRQSIDKSRESKRLLETAKRAVEIAIEQNEDAAMEYISANTQV